LNPIELIACILLLISGHLFAQQEATTPDGKKVWLYENGTWHYATQPTEKIRHQTETLAEIEIPQIHTGNEIIRHTAYALLYNESHEQASWVAYELTKEETQKVTGRTNKFIPDPAVHSGTACDEDYRSSGYDRGHLAPASDMGWSATTMAESFYYSNMSPQAPQFNRGIWKRLEDQVRSWAIENEAVYVVTGPVLRSGLPAIGPNSVSVPDFFFKAILDYREPEIKAIGFVMPNLGSSENLNHFAVSIDSVEKISGINFFPSIPDAEEEKIESSLCVPCWSWTSRRQEHHKIETRNASDSKQCAGITKSGKRCRRMTTSANGRCYQH
jgi:endonuclease G